MSDSDLTVVILREIRELAASTKKGLDETNARMDARFDAVDKRFDSVDKRFDAIEQRLTIVERGVQHLSDEMYFVKSHIRHIIDTAIEDLRRRMTRVESKA